MNTVTAPTVTVDLESLSKLIDKVLIDLPTSEGERKIALRNRWHTILHLLRLLLSVLHGHPELNDSGRTDAEKLALKRKRPNLFKMCEAVAHILPMSHEITAVTYSLTLEHSKFARSPFTTAILRLTVVVTGAREPDGLDRLEDQGTQEEDVKTAPRTNQYSQTLRNITKQRMTLFCSRNPVQAEPKERGQAAKTKSKTDQAAETKPNTPTHNETFSIKRHGVSHMPIISGKEGPWKALDFE